ncbi:MAG TPA: LamG-like jellyroll fold domain-containing protein [Candidatus Nitrosotenuis sp.]
MKKRRGISTLIGAVFFIIAFMSTVGYVAYSLNLLDNFGQAILVKNEEKIDREREEFEIVRVSRDNNRFNVTLQNTGNLPIEFTRLWIENTTDTDDTDRIFKFDINKVANPGETVTKIGQNLPVTSLPTQAYNLKILTDRGNAQEVSINSANQAPLYMKLYALPESIPTTFTTTLLLTVTNNMTNKNVLLNVQPNSAFTNSIDKIINCPSGSCTYTYMSGPDPPSYPVLRAGDTAYFRWVYDLSGLDNDKITFTASLENGLPANTASATVTITDVETALTAGTALKSEGLLGPQNPDDILIFHQETFFTPQNRYQMHTGNADQSGLNIQMISTSPKFFTNNGTLPIIISQGVWNASLRYYSAAMPPNLLGEGEDMIHHFEESGTPDDSAGNNDLTKCGGQRSPSFFSNSGPNSTGTYYFDGGDCMSRSVSGSIDINNEPDTTAFWFRHGTGQPPNVKQILLRWDDSQGGNDYYEIAIGGTGTNQGKIDFSYDTGTGGGVSQCVSTSNVVTDQKWHHIVAVRAANNEPPGMIPPATDDDCILYVDGVLQRYNLFALPGNNVDVDTLTVGSNRAQNNNFLVGYIDDVIHWNDKALSSTEVFDLYKTSYGVGAHKLNFVLSKTNQNGVLVPPVIETSNNYPLKFIDGKQVSDNSDSKYPGANYTFALPQVSLTAGERLNFTMSYSSGLNMIFRIDDNTMATPKSSFLQTGSKPDNPFHSYFSHDRDNEVQFFVSNSGPNGMWMTYQGTRVAFDTLSGTTSYAGLIHTVNGTTVDVNTDSIYVPVGAVADMRFYRPQTIPKTPETPANVIPTGTYQMYVFINGYDETGKVFLRTLSVGLIQVIP